MSRIRSIKPDFFTDETLGGLSPLHRILFAGLWTESDRDGRLEDRPRTLKVKLLPWDKCDVDRMLSDLDAIGRIQRYESDGKRCIAIANFSRHQRPHPKETSFGLPPPPCREISRKEIKDPTGIPSSTGGFFNGFGNGLGGGSGDGFEAKPEKDGSEIIAILPAAEFDLVQPPLTKAPEPHEQLKALWNEETKPPIPRWQGDGKARKKLAKGALERRPIDGPGGWREVFRLVNQAPLCRGETAGGWLASPEWALRPEGAKPEPASKLLEGAFAGTGPPAKREGKFTMAQDAGSFAGMKPGVFNGSW